MRSQSRIILTIGFLILIINLVLGVIYLRSGTLPFFNKQSEGTTSFSSSAARPFSVTKLIPLTKGNPFDVPVMNPNSQTALYTIAGRINDYKETSRKDGYLIKILRDNGQYIEETPFVSKSLKPLVVYKNGSTKEIQLSEVTKDEFAIISLNINTITKEVIVTGIRITR